MKRLRYSFLSAALALSLILMPCINSFASETDKNLDAAAESAQTTEAESPAEPEKSKDDAAFSEGEDVSTENETLVENEEEKNPDKEKETPLMQKEEVIVENMPSLLSGTDVPIVTALPNEISYTVKNESDLEALRNKIDRSSAYNVTLASDITLDNSWAGLGSSEFPFAGTFNGNSFTVTINKGAPLFNFVRSDSTIKNVGVFGTVHGSAAICDEITSLNATSSSGIIKNCYNAANVIGKEYAAGILGRAGGPIAIENCFNSGIIDASMAYGILGSTSEAVGENSITITNCYNTGRLTGSHRNVIAPLLAIDTSNNTTNFSNGADIGTHKSFTGSSMTGYTASVGLYPFVPTVNNKNARLVSTVPAFADNSFIYLFVDGTSGSWNFEGKPCNNEDVVKVTADSRFTFTYGGLSRTMTVPGATDASLNVVIKDIGNIYEDIIDECEIAYYQDVSSGIDIKKSISDILTWNKVTINGLSVDLVSSSLPSGLLVDEKDEKIKGRPDANPAKGGNFIAIFKYFDDQGNYGLYKYHIQYVKADFEPVFENIGIDNRYTYNGQPQGPTLAQNQAPNVEGLKIEYFIGENMPTSPEDCGSEGERKMPKYASLIDSPHYRAVATWTENDYYNHIPKTSLGEGAIIEYRILPQTANVEDMGISLKGDVNVDFVKEGAKLTFNNKFKEGEDFTVTYRNNTFPSFKTADGTTMATAVIEFTFEKSQNPDARNYKAPEKIPPVTFFVTLGETPAELKAGNIYKLSDKSGGWEMQGEGSKIIYSGGTEFAVPADGTYTMVKSGGGDRV